MVEDRKEKALQEEMARDSVLPRRHLRTEEDEDRCTFQAEDTRQAKVWQQDGRELA